MRKQPQPSFSIPLYHGQQYCEVWQGIMRIGIRKILQELIVETMTTAQIMTTTQINISTLIMISSGNPARAFG
jgi:hypothetical protein